MAFDKFKDECGVFGIWGHPEASNIAYLGIFAQQHRGQEGAGVVSLDISSETSKMHIHRGLGLVEDAFKDFDFSALPGRCAIGHVRYTTAGGNKIANVQPLYADIAKGPVAVAHNGNLINSDLLKRELIDEGSIFGTTSDTEVIVHLIARTAANTNPTESVIAALRKIRGAFSVLVLLKDRLIAARDPLGLRPLALGRLNGAWTAASETCAFDLVGAEFVRDVAPGEVVEIGAEGELTSYFPFAPVNEAPCIFEFIYFARPDSRVFGRNVYQVRKRLGEELAKEHPVAADMVVPVPDSGVPAAIGYAQASGIQLELGLIRNHYVGRTFIEPKQSIRDFGVKLKLNANPEVLAGKSIVVIDDSIVRGTTSRKLVAMLRRAGAKAVHLRISSPPTTDPCFYGIDTPQKGELIASSQSTAEIAAFIGVDSLNYLSREGMYRAAERAEGSMCDACFTGRYPAGVPSDFESRQTALFR